MNRLRNALLIATLACLHTASWAAQPLILPPNTFNPAQILPAPPADNSVQAEAERAYVKTAFTQATPEERAQAHRDATTESVELFANTIPGFDLDQLPATKALFKTVRANERVQTGAFKHYFSRRRPYQVDLSITPCVAPKNYDINASDPSGHSTMAFSSAIVLADLLPDYASAIMTRAENYGRNRIVCGAHHPFDVRSGQVLGTLIGATLLKSPALQPQLNAARAELAKQIPTAPRLQNTNWVATRINGNAVKANAPTLTIKKNRASGNSSCNPYTGKVTIGDGNALQFGSTASTRMTCINDIDQQEPAYLGALSNVTRYHLNVGELILLDKESNKVVEFKTLTVSVPQEPPQP